MSPHMAAGPSPTWPRAVTWVLPGAAVGAGVALGLLAAMLAVMSVLVEVGVRLSPLREPAGGRDSLAAALWGVLTHEPMAWAVPVLAGVVLGAVTVLALAPRGRARLGVAVGNVVAALAPALMLWAWLALGSG